MILQEAANHYKNGNFAHAHKLYTEASQKYGQDIVEYNLQLCEKQLQLQQDEAKKLEQSQITNSFLNNYFDKIYVVNLKHQVHERLKVSNHLHKSGINFELFEAVNGYEGEAYKRYEEYLKRPLGNFKRYPGYSKKEIDRGKPFIESAGAIGYILTYLKILNDAKDNEYKRFLILEDDIILTSNFEEKFKNFVNNISDNWKILQLGASQYGWDDLDIIEAESKGYYHQRPLQTMGSFAIAFDISILNEVIQAEEAFEAPFDHLPLSEIYQRHNNECFVAYPNIVIPDVSESTIRGGRCQYTHSTKMKWEIKNFNFPLSKPSLSVIISHKNNLKYYDHFSKQPELPFILRLYFNTEDGLRPLHSSSLLDTEISQIKPMNSWDILLPKSDYVATIENNEILSEKDLIQFIEYKTSIHKHNLTVLKDSNYTFNPTIKNRVSVIIPTYKRPTNLKNALSSIIAQDYPDIEIIVISDNGENSSYNIETREIVKSFQKQSKHYTLKLLEHKRNRNGSAARNTGIMASSGEYICFLDDDDIYLPQRLSNSVKKLKMCSKNIGAVYCGFLGWNSQENDLKRYKTGDLTYEILSLDYKKHYLHTNTATYKREAILTLNGFDESYKRHQDLEFNLRFFQNYEIDVVEECLVQLNPEPSGVSNKVFNRDMFDIKEKFLSQFKPQIMNYKDNKEIYAKHWNEVIKYSQNLEKLSLNLSTDYTDGKIQILNNLIKTSDEITVFPIGTCRLHEPLELIQEIGVQFPGVGYFHSSTQVVDWLKVLNNELSLNHQTRNFFFRKDETNHNNFDLALWDNNKFINTLENKKKAYQTSSILFIEICSLKTWIYNGISVQGNPNSEQDIPYSEVWKNGYYNKYKTSIKVDMIQEDENLLFQNLLTIDSLLIKNNQKAIIMGHLVDPKKPHPARLNHNTLLKKSINKLQSKNIIYFDVNNCLVKYGFKIDKNGKEDIHHVSNFAMKCIADNMSKVICTVKI